MQGMGALFWMPIIIKYGRRPVYVLSFSLYLACAGWAGGATSYGSELASRIIMGLAAGAAEVMAQLTISDIFFLHKRGTIMAICTFALSAGVGGSIVISGLITIVHGWRMIYWVATALIAACTFLVIFAFPETAYPRSDPLFDPHAATIPVTQQTVSPKEIDVEKSEGAGAVSELPLKRTYFQSLAIFSRKYTDESLFKLFFRPVVLLTLPPVFWATLVMSGAIGFLVAITSNFAPAFENTYGFKPWQASLCFIGSLIGSAFGILFGGHFSDWVADALTRRNGGIREPEMRLPAILVSVVTAPLALTLYGVGINNHLSWVCPTFGLLLSKLFAIQVKLN